MWYIHNRMLQNFKEKCNHTIHYNIDITGRYYVKRNKAEDHTI